MAGAVRVGLPLKIADEASRIIQAKLKPLLSEDAQVFNNNDRFSKAINEALEMEDLVELAAKVAAKGDDEGGVDASIKRIEQLAESGVELYQHSDVVDLSDVALGEGANATIIDAWMHSDPSELVKLKINGRAARADIIIALQELVARVLPRGCSNPRQTGYARLLPTLRAPCVGTDHDPD